MVSLRLVIFLRYPVPGEVKTRLIPALGPDGAAECYHRLAEHTLAIARASGLDIELRVTGGEPAEFASWLGDDLTIVPQGEGDLGARLTRISAPAIVIGSDAPGLTPDLLRQAALGLDDHDAIIGPASDGGYYLIGLSRPMPFLFVDMAWSTPQVGSETVKRLQARGVPFAMLPELDDIDEPADLAAWPDFAP